MLNGLAAFNSNWKCRLIRSVGYRMQARMRGRPEILVFRLGSHKRHEVKATSVKYAILKTESVSRYHSGLDNDCIKYFSGITVEVTAFEHDVRWTHYFAINESFSFNDSADRRRQIGNSHTLSSE